jgi:hypothetical protein
MVQAVENRTELRGTVLGRRAHPSLPDFELLQVRVQETKPIDGYADLLSSTAGSTIDLTVRRGLLPSGALEGSQLRCRAYRGGPNAILAEPHPANDSFSITPSV